MAQIKVKDVAEFKAKNTVVGITDKLLGGKAGVKKPFRMAAKDGVGEIFIYDDIGGGFFDEGITAKSFAADLKALGKVRTLDIFINSPGGSVFEGVAIFNQLKRHSARKVVHIDGMAASIASVIAMAGDEINIAANGFVMIHEAWAFAIGDAAELRKRADQLEKISDSILNTYAERTGTPENVIADMMAAETWMNAEEAVEHGFADQITKEVAIAAHFDLGQFQNVPEDVAAKLDLANNPPKVDVGGGTGAVGPESVAFEEIHEVISASGEVISRSRKLIPAVSIDDLEGGPALLEDAEALDAELSRRVEKAAASIAGKVGALLPADSVQAGEPAPEPRTPSLAVAKMRQHIQKRGIVRKDDDETAATA